jgi:puromycin-sensitive aminopeptidase
MSDAFRLPRDVVPRRYDLTIAPDLGASKFSGSVRITLDVVERTDTIVCNARDLVVVVDEVSQGGAGRGEIAATLDTHADVERVVITTERPLEPGPAVLALSFEGEISSGLLGFYRSTFVDDDGNQRVLAATQFEAPHARAAFPCFDEPDLKAVFGITLTVDKDLVALSNGPEVSRTESGGLVRVTFADTIPMSTYLVAWVVGPLEISAPLDADGVAVRVVHVPGRAHLTAFALDIGAFALRFFSDYYAIPYPGEKCDLVALPDFSFGAMENLGLVTFRENRLLLDPAHVTLDERMAAALTIVHEVAHMWFGDLVTMKWWNGIWLNEAFATFMEHLGCDAYEPRWKTWDDFAVGRAAALGVDALPSTRTVEYEVCTPEDADGMFDTLTYQKGGSVLRMLERWLGGDAFRAGVRHYLQRYQYANTETTDLWDALEDATGHPVRQIMDSWIFQPGFPVLTVTDATSLRVVQERFAFEATDSHERYAVPLMVRVHADGRAETRSLLLSGDATSIDLPDDALAVLNAGGEGFYRVAYPPAARDRLLDAGVLEPLERFALIDDLWAAVLAGAATASDYVETARRFIHERELVVWRALAAHLRAQGRLVDGAAEDRFREVVTSIVQPSMLGLGWRPGPDDDDRRRQLRGLLISLLGTVARNTDAITRAREIVAQSDGVDPDVAAAAVGVVASVGSQHDFEEYVRRFTEGKTPQEQLRYLYALGDFPDEQLVLRAAELALSDAVRPQSAPFVLQAALRNRARGAAAWGFVRDNWSMVRGRCSGTLVARMLEGVTWLVDAPTFDDVLGFVVAHPIPEAARVIHQHLDRLRLHRRLVERERERFAAALSSTR